jgi:hypothetical protein
MRRYSILLLALCCGYSISLHWYFATAINNTSSAKTLNTPTVSSTINYLSSLASKALSKRQAVQEVQYDMRIMTFTTEQGVQRLVAVYVDNPTIPPGTLHGKPCRFVNLSNRTLFLYIRRIINEKNSSKFIHAAQAMGSANIACHDDQIYHFYDPHAFTSVQLFPIVPEQNWYVHDESDAFPYWDITLRQQYTLWKDTLTLAPIYYEWTKRVRLSHAHRSQPIHYMYPSDYTGQIHATPTTHHYDPHQSTLYLTVVSHNPRVFRILHFLSTDEVDHIQWLGSLPHAEWTVSETGTLHQYSQQQTLTIEWDRSTVLETIYARAADVLQVPVVTFIENSEPMHLVHTIAGQIDPAHYDFDYPPVHHAHQPTCFATLVLSIKVDCEDGWTGFPRVPMRIAPDEGQALLIYHMLPDGNMDEWAQYETLPMASGEQVRYNILYCIPMTDIGTH